MVRVRYTLWGANVTQLIHRLRDLHGARGFAIAFVGLAFSASLAFGAQPTATGLANAALHAGKTVPVQAQDEQTAGDETTDDSTDVNADAGESGDNCSTDPTGLTAEELAAMRHGSIVCWAAQQTSWPDWFTNHGAFVKCWAHQGKADAVDCTTAPPADAPTGAAPTTHGASAGHGQGKDHNNK